MLTRKINAAVSLLTTFLVLFHAITTSVKMLSMGRISLNVGIIPRVLCGVMLIHAVISIDMVVSAIMESKANKCKKYPKQNAFTFIQRISGFLLIIFAALHVGGTAGPMRPPKVVHAILPPLFFTVTLLHVAVSTGKAFITLGIGNAKIFKAVDIAVKVICVATLIAAVTGFYLFSV